MPLLRISRHATNFATNFETATALVFMVAREKRDNETLFIRYINKTERRYRHSRRFYYRYIYI